MKLTVNKKILSFSLLLLLVFSFSLANLALAAVNPLTNLSAAARGTGLEGNTNLAKFIGAFISTILGSIGVVFVVLLIYAGFTWGTAAGNEKKVEDAKNIIKTAVIGLAIVLLSYGITQFVVNSITAAGGSPR